MLLFVFNSYSFSLRTWYFLFVILFFLHSLETHKKNIFYSFLFSEDSRAANWLRWLILIEWMSEWMLWETRMEKLSLLRRREKCERPAHKYKHNSYIIHSLLHFSLSLPLTISFSFAFPSLHSQHNMKPLSFRASLCFCGWGWEGKWWKEKLILNVTSHRNRENILMYLMLNLLWVILFNGISGIFNDLFFLWNLIKFLIRVFAT